MTLDYGIIDCDTHCYEPRDAFTRYLPKAYLDRAITPVRDAERRRAHPRRTPRRDVQQRVRAGLRHGLPPGNAEGDAQADGLGQPRRDLPARADPAASTWSASPRLRIDAGAGRRPLRPVPGRDGAGRRALRQRHRRAVRQPPLVQPLVRRGRGASTRTERSTPPRSCRCATSIERWRSPTRSSPPARKFVLLPTGPAYGRSPGDPYFDPVWSRLNEAGVTVAFHIMPFWYFDAISPAWGHDTDPASWHMSAWQWMNIYGERPIVDTISALIFDNVFGRFPDIDVLIAEHGASWVPHTLEHMDKSRGMGRNGPWIGGKLDERPSAIFQRRVRVAPYPEDDIPAIVDEPRRRPVVPRDGVRLPARRGSRRAGRVRQDARSARRADAAGDHVRQRGAVVRSATSARRGDLTRPAGATAATAGRRQPAAMSAIVVR